ncbi:GH32 C-terminal domain-containing protein [Halalkalibacter lacteus]
MNVRVFADKSMDKIFINYGELALSARVFPQRESRLINFF